MTPDDSASVDWSRFGVGVPLRPSPYLRHVESGTVSISSTGQELAFGLARSLTLDATHLVNPPKGFCCSVNNVDDMSIPDSVYALFGPGTSATVHVSGRRSTNSDSLRGIDCV